MTLDELTWEPLTEAIMFSSVGHTALIRIARPQARNAVDHAVATGLEAAVDRIEEDPDLWVGILTGDGGAFSAGADLKQVGRGNASQLETARGGFAGYVRRQRTKPIIAAVEGFALAGGFEIVLACDLVVAAAGATFALPEVKRGLISGAGGLLRLGRKVPPNVAMHLSLTGESLTAAEARAHGVVTVLCPDGTAASRAIELADAICENAPLAVRVSRELVNAAVAPADEAAEWRALSEASDRIVSTEDAIEGVRAFVERRIPQWTGR